MPDKFLTDKNRNNANTVAPPQGMMCPRTGPKQNRNQPMLQRIRLQQEGHGSAHRQARMSMTHAGGRRKPGRSVDACNTTAISSMFLLDTTSLFAAKSPLSSPERLAVAQTHLRKGGRCAVFAGMDCAMYQPEM